MRLAFQAVQCLFHFEMLESWIINNETNIKRSIQKVSLTSSLTILFIIVQKKRQIANQCISNSNVILQIEYQHFEIQITLLKSSFNGRLNGTKRNRVQKKKEEKKSHRSILTGDWQFFSLFSQSLIFAQKGARTYKRKMH